MVAMWLQDYHSPFYIAPRIGKGGQWFKKVKLYSMVVNADRSGVDSTSANDSRSMSIRRFIRCYRLDELMQIWNVLKEVMSLVAHVPIWNVMLRSIPRLKKNYYL